MADVISEKSDHPGNLLNLNRFVAVYLKNSIGQMTVAPIQIEGFFHTIHFETIIMDCSFCILRGHRLKIMMYFCT